MPKFAYELKERVLNVYLFETRSLVKMIIMSQAKGSHEQLINAKIYFGLKVKLISLIALNKIILTKDIKRITSIPPKNTCDYKES